MADPYRELFDRARRWFERGRQSGWLVEGDLERLRAAAEGSPGDLFVDEQARPLVVAFFGGTGVGKSSLLNRLAGEEVARTGVERPTSREVTVYVHEAVALADLPGDLPVEAVQIKRHRADVQRELLWLDAPDIDSTEAANRQNALAWLPHVDLVCYVVSPERYRDDIGWRVLKERGHRHGWLFVMNRWDEGDVQQAQDFVRMLDEAGFEDPVLLRTSCNPGGALPSEDQFAQLQETLVALLRAHGVRELTRLGHRARLQELRKVLEVATRRFGDKEAWEDLEGYVAEAWQHAAETIREGAEWSLNAAAARFAHTESGIIDQVRRGVAAARARDAEAPAGGDTTIRDVPVDELVAGLWDEWAQSKAQAAGDALELRVRRAGMTAEPIRRGVDAVVLRAGETVSDVLRDIVRVALARPGSALTRFVRRVTGFLMVFLPAAALAFVAWNVVTTYPQAAQGKIPYLGTEFAIHSGLLVLVAWAVPFTIDRLLKPSVQRTVRTALRRGLVAGLEELGTRLGGAVNDARATADSGRSEGERLLEDVDRLLDERVDRRVPALDRLMARSGADA